MNARLETLTREAKDAWGAEQASGKIRINVCLDTSSSNAWTAMEPQALTLGEVFGRSLAVVGPTRLLFGTDSSFFPRGWNYEVYEAQTRALLDLGVSGSDARLILEGNMAAMFQ